MKTVLDLWCEFRGQQGGTIHQAKHEFRYDLTTAERNKFCSLLLNNSDTMALSEKCTVRDMMALRLEAERIIIEPLCT